jgi:hypothetical protein
LLVRYGAKAVQPGIGLVDGLQNGIDVLDRGTLLGADEGGRFAAGTNKSSVDIGPP